MTDSQERGSIDRRGFMVAATGIAASWALPIRVVAQDGSGEPVTRILPDFTAPEGWLVPFGEPELGQRC